MTTYSLHQGSSPLMISVPHAGTEVPDDILSRLSVEGKSLEDTDWYVDHLYDFAADLGATMLVATHSRYVIDLNRAPDGEPLYPDADETELCPTSNFNWRPIYKDGQGLEASEPEARLRGYWRPYHAALQSELERIRTVHGHVVLWDAHSIRSRVPRFFDGRLPDFNFGSGGGSSSEAALGEGLMEMAGQMGLNAVRDQRFRGGYITRHYGAPANGVHAVQLELTWRNYMLEEAPYIFDETLAGPTRKALAKLLVFGRDFKPA